MSSLEILIGVGYAILFAGLLSKATKIASPITAIGLGIALNIIPIFRDVSMPAEMVLLLFLPILLYWESLTTSLQEIRYSLLGIILTSTVLVVFTAACVAVTLHWVGFSWQTSWIIGAAVAPTDATAVSAMGNGLTRRNMTILKAESLINDGTALVVYSLAIGLATGEKALTFGGVSSMFGISFIGGILVGLACGMVIAFVGKYFTGIAILGNVMMILTPLTAFLLAELIEASGVLAVVVCGLYMSQVGPKFISTGSRVIATPFWTVVTYLLNGALFVMVGVEIPNTVSGISEAHWARSVIGIVAVFVCLLVSRFVFINISIAVIRLLDRSEQQRARRTTFKGRLISVFAGFRGAVSLAVALSVPVVLDGGEAFPDRDAIIFITAGVVMMTLIVQGAIFPKVVAWAAPEVPETKPDNELHYALVEASRRVQRELPQLGRDNQVCEDIVEEQDREYQSLQTMMDPDSDDAAAVERHRQSHALRLAAIARKKQIAVAMRDAKEIDDSILNEIIRRLDVEEIRLTGPIEVE